jgi:AraC-like DNA-binding protein
MFSDHASGSDLVTRWPFPERYNFETKRFAAARRYVSWRTHGLCEIVAGPRKSFCHYGLSWVPLLRQASVVLLSATSECEWEVITRVPDGLSIAFHLLLNGSYRAESGRDAVDMEAGVALFLGDAGRVLKHHEKGPSQQVLVSFDIKSLERILEQNFGVSMTSPLRFPPMLAISADRYPFLFDFLRLVLQDYFSDAPLGLHPVLRDQNERFLLSLLLRILPHNYADAVHSSSVAVPSHVKRAEHFITMNFRRNLTLNDIAQSVGVSPRTLQYAFRDFRGTTPMHFFKNVRLKVARELLQRSLDTPCSISAIASQVGYGDLSCFSRDYKIHFGEPPSHTGRRLRCQLA